MNTCKKSHFVFSSKYCLLFQRVELIHQFLSYLLASAGTLCFGYDWLDTGIYVKPAFQHHCCRNIFVSSFEKVRKDETADFHFSPHEPMKRLLSANITILEKSTKRFTCTVFWIVRNTGWYVNFSSFYADITIALISNQ